MQAIISELKNFLQGKVKFAFVYGSVLTQYFNEDSDIDVAVFLGRPIDFATSLKFSEETSKHFEHKHEFDLVVLDTADPIIAMQVLANGKLILNDDFEAFIKYKSRMISHYLDFKMDRKIIEDKIADGSIYE